jgi:DNA polymerase elongation subunit (family B)
MLDPIINGRGTTEKIVSVAEKRGLIHVYAENDKGVHLTTHQYRPWVLADTELDEQFQLLEGNNEYKYIRFFSTTKAWKEFKREWKHSIWSPRTLVDEWLLTSGETYFQDMKRKEVSILCFDIETTGLTHDDRSKVLIISNTYRKGDVQFTKMFALDDYDSQRHMLDAWCEWVRKLNPSILATYNGFSFDIPYMMYCAHRCGAELRIGRDGTAIELELFESKFRQDQHRSINYRMPKCFGRELVDLFFVVQKWDIAKKFSRYSLKTVIKEAGLERTDRVMVNAGQIYQYWDRRHAEPSMWEEVKRYAEHDADDTLAVADMVLDAYFYSSSLIPFTFERMCLSSSGAQLNAIMLRHYLSNGKSVAKSSEKVKYQGAISFGKAGIFNNVFKIDVASLYPSIISSFQLYDKKKDPDGIYLYMNNFFRTERLKYKKLAKETGEEYYAAMDAVYKALVNSVYGAAGASGCNYNAPAIAAKVTEEGRNILMQSIAWAEAKGFFVVNGDTDSISFTVPDSDPAYLKGLLAEVNGIMREGIRFEDDGFFPKFVILKAKNYIMLTQDGKIKLKGSALKSSKIEKGVRSFYDRCIRALLGLSSESLPQTYTDVCLGLSKLTSMSEWSSKKTISERTVKPAPRKDGKVLENKILSALAGKHYQLGDKFDFYFTNEGKLKVLSDYDPTNPDHDLKRLLGKIYRAASVFDSVSPELAARTNYGLTTKAKDYNDMARAKVLPVKKKKPTPKNVLQELLSLLSRKELQFRDDYADEMFRELVQDAETVLTPKPKKSRKKDCEPTQNEESYD